MMILDTEAKYKFAKQYPDLTRQIGASNVCKSVAQNHLIWSRVRSWDNEGIS